MDSPEPCCCSEATYGFSCESTMHHDHHDHHETADKDLHEWRYNQLVKEKEDLERSYEEERRDRESTERRYRQEFEEKALFENRFSDLNNTLQKYEEQLNLLRSENGHLNSQFERLRSAVNSRVGSGVYAGYGNSSTLTGFGAGQLSSSSVIGTSLGQEAGNLSLSSTASTSGALSSDVYKQEVSILAQENEIFKQIIDIIDKQERDKATWDSKMSETFTSSQECESNGEMTRLQDDNFRLKSRIRELEKNSREQESALDDLRLDAEEESRKAKREITRLEEDLYSKSNLVDDYESQILQIKSEYSEEIQHIELKLEAELATKLQLQVQVQVLENSIQRLEEERKEMVIKLEELYNSENYIIVARSELEGRYSQEINELQIRLEEEIRGKLELSQEMTVVMNEFIELRNHSKQMEEIYRREIEDMRIRFSGAGGGAVGIGVNNRSIVQSQQVVPQQAITGVISQGVNNGVMQYGSDMQVQLNDEIQKSKALENENKKLLYQMNNLLSGFDSSSTMEIHQHGKQLEMDANHDEGTDETTKLKKKIRSLENQMIKLTDEYEDVKRYAKKRKDLETKNRDLMDEVDDLSSKRDEMVRKQKALMNDIDNSSSLLQDVAARNRKLTTEIDTMVNKIHDMEDSFRQERNSLIRSYDREKASKMDDITRRKDDLQRTLEDQTRLNRSLEERIRELENEIRSLRSQYDRQSAGRNSNNEASSVDHLKAELQRSAEDIKRKTDEFEKTLQERNQMYDDHLKALKDQKRQLHDEFEREKESLRRRFENERQELENRLNGVGNRAGGQHGSPSFDVNVGYHDSQREVYAPNGGNVNQKQATSQFGPLQGGITPHQQSQVYESAPTGLQSPQPAHGNVLHGRITHQQGQSYGVFQDTRSQPSAGHPQYAQHNTNVNQPCAATQGGPLYSQDSQFTQTIAMLQQEVKNLRTEKGDMENRMRNLERRLQDGKMDFRSRNAPGSERHLSKVTPSNRDDHVDNRKRGVQFQMQDTFRQKVDDIQIDYTNQLADVERRFEKEKLKVDLHGETTMRNYDGCDFSGDGLDSKLHSTMKKLVDEQREHAEELQKQLKLQKESFENERKHLLLKIQNSASGLTQDDKEKLLVTIQSLKKEVHVLKHDRENLLGKLRRDRKEFESRQVNLREETSRVRIEYEEKLRQESNRSQKTVEELRRKISTSESRLKDIDIKLRSEMKHLEKRYSQEKVQIEASIRETEEQVRLKFELLYQTNLKTEKEKYEETLKELRKEINCLQDQRKQIQLKLSSHETSNVQKLAMSRDTNFNVTLHNKDLYSKLEREFTTRIAHEKRTLEDTIEDLRREIDELKKEKSDIKSSYKQDKVQMEEDFEREKQRLEERYRRERADLKRQLEMDYTNVKVVTAETSPRRYYHNRSRSVGISNEALVRQKSLSLEYKNSELEGDITFLKRRLKDLESRQKQFLLSQNRNSSGMDERRVRISTGADANHTANQLRRSTSSIELRDNVGFQGNLSSMGSFGSLSLGTTPLPSNQGASSFGLQGPSQRASYIKRYSSGMRSSGISHSLGSSASRIGGAAYSGSSLGREYGSYREICHMPSAGILNGGVGLAKREATFFMPNRGDGGGYGMSSGGDSGGGMGLGHYIATRSEGFGQMGQGSGPSLGFNSGRAGGGLGMLSSGSSGAIGVGYGISSGAILCNAGTSALHVGGGASGSSAGMNSRLGLSVGSGGMNSGFTESGNINNSQVNAARIESLGQMSHGSTSGHGLNSGSATVDQALTTGSSGGIGVGSGMSSGRVLSSSANSALHAREGDTGMTTGTGLSGGSIGFSSGFRESGNVGMSLGVGMNQH